MKFIKILVILTVISNALILIGVGHGVAPLIVVEILGFKWLFTDFNSINILGNYDQRLVPTAIISLIFQGILFSSLFIKKVNRRRILINLSTIALIVNLIYLTKDFAESNLDLFTLKYGIPFLVLSIVLLLANYINAKFDNSNSN